MSYFFSSESVSEGHPDKVADQISDAILDQFLAYDDHARVACESFVTTGQVVIMGEVRSEVYIDLQTIARNTIKKIGYTKAEYQFDGNSCGILTAIHEQSEDINRGVDREDDENQGAGDQGMMFGYATNETESLMPVSLDLAHLLMRTLAEIRKEGKVMTYLRPDAKSQVTVQYSDAGIPERIDTIVVSTQHDEFDTDDERMLQRIREDVINILIPRVKSKIHSQAVLSLFGNEPGLAIKAGVELGYLVSGKFKDNHNTLTNTSDFKRVNISIPAGISYNYRHIVLDLRYNIGLMNMCHKELEVQDSWKANSLWLTVGYQFEL